MKKLDRYQWLMILAAALGLAPKTTTEWQVIWLALSAVAIVMLMVARRISQNEVEQK